MIKEFPAHFPQTITDSRGFMLTKTPPYAPFQKPMSMPGNTMAAIGI